MSFNEKEVWLNGSDYIELNSVGSTLTSENMVFPIDCSEAPETASDAEEMSGVHLMDVDDEWWENLDFVTCWELFHYIEDNVDYEKNWELFNSFWRYEKLKLSGKEQILTFVEGS